MIHQTFLFMRKWCAGT